VALSAGSGWFEGIVPLAECVPLPVEGVVAAAFVEAGAGFAAGCCATDVAALGWVLVVFGVFAGVVWGQFFGSLPYLGALVVMVFSTCVMISDLLFSRFACAVCSL
jgi:hypothetical protein